MKKLILHIPHASTHFPSTDGFILDQEKIQQEIIKFTDWYTNDLFYSATDEMVIAPFSRLFCDVERFANDEEESMSKFGMGALYQKFDDGSLLRTLNPEIRAHIMNDFYWKHHDQLTEVVDQQLEINGTALIIDCHSFPDIPFHYSVDKTSYRPDFNIGTDGYHTPVPLINLAEGFFRYKGYTVQIDEPYSGSIVPLTLYGKNENVQSIMLEINRRLYLNEPSNEKSARYEEIKSVVADFIGLMKMSF
jgi:N-formylglutamate amidohydrolase